MDREIGILQGETYFLHIGYKYFFLIVQSSNFLFKSPLKEVNEHTFDGLGFFLASLHTLHNLTNTFFISLLICSSFASHKLRLLYHRFHVTLNCSVYDFRTSYANLFCDSVVVVVKKIKTITAQRGFEQESKNDG